MRLRHLFLEAFGPFTDEELDLSGGAPGGLHVIYGPNEAGKSTSLRAVEGLLFGIPERSGDAHVHALRNLAVGAVLERGEGKTREELRITRRKRRKDSLVDGGGQPLPDNILDAWLFGIDQRSFFSRFGLDQGRLERGAEALLGGSEEGLFAAGTGGPDVARLLQELQAEGDALYRPRAQRPLNRALAGLGEATRIARHAERPPEKWREQKRAHEQALERVRVLTEERRRLKLEGGRLSRLASVLSDVSRWVDATEELERLGPQPDLPIDAETQRHEAQGAHRDAQREHARLSLEIEELAQRLSTLPPPSTLAEVEEERWALLEKKIGWEIKAREDRPKLEGKLAGRLDELRRLLARLGQSHTGDVLARADELRVEAALERRVQRLGVRHAEVALVAVEARRQRDELQEELAVARALVEREESTELDVDALEASLNAARRVQARAEQAVQLREERDRLEARAARLRKELGVTVADVELRARIPSEPLVEEGERELQALGVEERRLLERRAEEQARLDRAQAALTAQARAGEVPSEALLAELRAARDAAFEQLSAIVEDAAAVRRWSEELVQRIGAADRVADRLRLEAHRVSEREQHLQLEESARLALQRLDQELALLRQRWTALEETWRARWAALGMDPVAPTGLSAARARLKDLLTIGERLAECERQLAALAAEQARVGAELRKALGDAASLTDALDDGLVERAARRLAEVRQDQERRRSQHLRIEELGLRLQQQEARAKEAVRRLEAWQAQWRQALSTLHLPQEMPPDEVQAVLGELTELARVADDARDKQRRIDGIDRDSRQLEELVRSLVERHAPDLRSLEPLEAAQALVQRVREVRQIERDRARLEAELREKRRAASEARRLGDEAWSRIESLVQRAGVRDPAELPRVEAEARRARELAAERIELEQVLRSKAGAGSLRELIDEARSVSHHELIAQRDEVEARLEEVEEELRSAEHDASSIERGLELYRSEDAAIAQQRVANAQAEARGTLRDFLVLRTARVLLEREMTRYAEKYQGPILARATDLFSRLTLDKYSALRVGMGERTLRCLREGREVEVHELSRGTRAQLYLALRLASLEQHFEVHPPIPLVFDDLLVDFDDDRACAAFELLGELAERVQILYFTHLGRDLQAARDAVPPNLLFEHRIGIGVPAVRQAASGRRVRR